MLGLIYRALTHKYRLRAALSDVTYYRRGIEHYQYQLALAEKHLSAVQAEEVEIRFPSPVRRG